MKYCLNRILASLLVALPLYAASGCASREADPTLGATYEPAKPANQPAAGNLAAAAPGPDDPDPDAPDPDAPGPAADDEDFDDSDFDDSAFDDASPGSKETIADPLRPWNQMWFAFNNFVYLKILKPLYRGYRFIVPRAIRSGLSNVQRNLKAPVRIINSILQLEFAQAVVEFGRFIVNTTVGGLGLAEVVKHEAARVPINLETANFGGTLAKWGLGEGIYLVWPIIGPSTLRDSIGMAGNMFAGIPFWISRYADVDDLVRYTVSYWLDFNDFGGSIDTYETLTKAAIEPYAAVRDAYVKYRRQNNVTMPVHVDNMTMPDRLPDRLPDLLP